MRPEWRLLRPRRAMFQVKPEWRRLLPIPAAFFVGVLGSLLLGQGPRSTVATDAGQEGWALPVSQAPDLAAADGAWAERHPWGRPAATAAEAARAAPVAVPVGVVAGRGGRHQALFSLDGALPVAVDEGGVTPDGGTVTSIAPTVVAWQDAAGQPKRVELFQEGRASTSAPVPASTTTPASRPDRPAPDERGRMRGPRPSPSGG